MPTALLLPQDVEPFLPLCRGLQALGWRMVAPERTVERLVRAGAHAVPATVLTPGHLSGDDAYDLLRACVHADLFMQPPRSVFAAGYPPVEAPARLLVTDYAFTRLHGEVASVVSLVHMAVANGVEVVVDPDDCEAVVRVLARYRSAMPVLVSSMLAAKAMDRVALYFAHVSHLLHRVVGDDFPETLVVGMAKVQHMRYGENPHQRAALYAPLSGSMIR